MRQKSIWLQVSNDVGQHSKRTRFEKPDLLIVREENRKKPNSSSKQSHEVMQIGSINCLIQWKARTPILLRSSVSESSQNWRKSHCGLITTPSDFLRCCCLSATSRAVLVDRNKGDLIWNDLPQYWWSSCNLYEWPFPLFLPSSCGSLSPRDNVEKWNFERSHLSQVLLLHLGCRHNTAQAFAKCCQGKLHGIFMNRV